MSGTTSTHTYPPMPAHAPVTFPPQPPHSNVLSPEERARLLRSNKKLARLLGSTPHFVDQDSVESPWTTTDDPAATPLSRPSTSTSASLARVPTKSLSRIASKPSRPSTAQGTYASESPSREDAWRARKATLRPTSKAGAGGVPPVLKLAFSATEGLPLTAVAADAPRPALPSPSSYAIPALGSRYRGDNGAEQEIDLPLRSAPIRRSRSTVRPEAAAPGHAHARSPSSPTFPIPTEASARRTKLDKLRRTLGEELPAKAVFPSNSSSSSKASSPSKHKSSKSMSHSRHAHNHGQERGHEQGRGHASRSSDPSVSVIALPGANGDQTHTVVLKTSTATSSRPTAAATVHPSASSHHYKRGPAVTDPRDLLSLAGVETEDGAGLLGARRKPTASATLGGDAFVKARRAKTHGRPEIEFVGFLGHMGV